MLVYPLIKSIDWGDLDYGSHELVECTLQVDYDWAVLRSDLVGNEIKPTNKEYNEFMKLLKEAKDARKGSTATPGQQ